MRREHLHLTVLVLLSLLLQSALSDDADDYVRLGETRAARAAMGSGDAVTMIDDDDYSGSDMTQVVSPSSTVVPRTSASSSAVVSLTSASLESSLSSASPTPSSTYDGSGGDTLQVLNPSSTVESLTSASSSTVESLTSASSSTVASLPSASPTPTPVLPVAPSCTLLKGVVSPSTVTGTEEELRRRALCHAACVADQVTISTVVAYKMSACQYSTVDFKTLCEHQSSSSSEFNAT